MLIHHDINLFKATNPVITIGTFDGVHLGHKQVISRLNNLARNVQGESVIFTFYPHPRLVVSAHESNLRLLTTFEEKARLIEEAGIDHLVVYPFTIDFAELTYEQFIREILIEKLGLHTLVIGHDHRLGKNREGTFDNVVALSQKLHFGVEKIETFLINNVDISSSKVRNALQKGEIEKANEYLGYNYQLTGTVASGSQIGRNIGFPTANIVTADFSKLIPDEGVYAVTVSFEGKTYNGMLNIGYRPTIDANADHRTIEVHIFAFEGDIYQKEITIKFLKRIRDEKKFASIEDLRLQLIEDRKTVESLFPLPLN
ncbi:MAG TPA: bifunctional riboflavin kinase/FAD synthetase [Prolixibacteraceae bacterium]|nr:bifunctional riboflavin kinase/FAD synthetase [Prolixibacteraceae bacterium]